MAVSDDAGISRADSRRSLRIIFPLTRLSVNVSAVYLNRKRRFYTAIKQIIGRAYRSRTGSAVSAHLSAVYYYRRFVIIASRNMAARRISRADTTGESSSDGTYIASVYDDLTVRGIGVYASANSRRKVSADSGYRSGVYYYFSRSSGAVIISRNMRCSLVIFCASAYSGAAAVYFSSV